MKDYDIIDEVCDEILRESVETEYHLRDRKYTHEEYEAYWEGAEAPITAKNPYEESTEPELFDAWNKGNVDQNS